MSFGDYRDWLFLPFSLSSFIFAHAHEAGGHKGKGGFGVKEKARNGTRGVERREGQRGCAHSNGFQRLKDRLHCGTELLLGANSSPWLPDGGIPKTGRVAEPRCRCAFFPVT